MTAQIWLWAALSGLGLGIAGWWIRGWQTSGREMRIKRAYEARLCAVEEDAKRVLVRARREAAEDRRRLEATRDALFARLAELEPSEAEATEPPTSVANGSGAPPVDLPPPKPSRRPRPRNGAGPAVETAAPGEVLGPTLLQ